MSDKLMADVATYALEHPVSSGDTIANTETSSTVEEMIAGGQMDGPDDEGYQTHYEMKGNSFHGFCVFHH